MTRAVLLSVKPIYAESLLNGTKTAEVRRRFPDQPDGTVLYVYATSPVRALIGTVLLDRVTRVNAAQVWSYYQRRIQIGATELENYLAGVETAAMLEVSAPTVWDRAVSLTELRTQLHLNAPQSFRYLGEVQVDALRGLSRR